MKKQKKHVVFVIALAIQIIGLFGIKQSLYAEEYWPEGIETGSPNAIVMEMNTGTVLYEKNVHEQRYPASITKIMTTLLAVENCDMDETVVFSADAVYKNEGNTSHIARDLKEEMTMEECLYAVMLASANECAYAVAEHVGQKLGGDYQTFIDLMNERARELGCKNTNFMNCNGLPDTEHVTTAYDMALISSAAYKNENFRQIAGAKTYTIPPTNKHEEETYLQNHHNMLYPYKTRAYLYEYCEGGKTGYTQAANSTLVTYAQKDGMSLVCVVMNTKTPNHWEDTIALFDYYFNNFQTLNILENAEIFSEKEEQSMGVLNSNAPFVTIDTGAYIVIPKTVTLEETSFRLIEEKETSGKVAKLQYSYAGHEVGSAEIVLSDVEVQNSLMEKSQSFQEETTEQEAVVEKKEFVLKPIYFVFLGVALLVLIIVILIVRKFMKNFYILRHNHEMKKLQRTQYRTVRQRKRPRRRDRMFR